MDLKILLPFFVGNLVTRELYLHRLGLIVKQFDRVRDFIEFGMFGVLGGLVSAGMILAHFIKFNLLSISYAISAYWAFIKVVIANRAKKQ